MAQGRTPTYRRHKPTGQAVVTLDGRDFYLGRHGTPASRAEYDRLVGEWLANGRRMPGSRDLTVAELMLAFWEHAQAFYVKDGRPTSEVESIRQALRPVRTLYAHTLARDFGPLALKAVREEMIRTGWARTHINRQLERVRRMFKWAAENELLPVTLYQALLTVEGLKKGRSGAKEGRTVRPVPDDQVEKALAHMRPTVAAMVRVQRLAGMRPHEVMQITGAAIDRSDPTCWVYRPGRHKGEHRGKDRIIFLGPRAQAILGPFLEAARDGYLFSPRRSEAERNAEKRAGRVTPRWPSHCNRTPKARPRTMPGDCYKKDSHRQAVQRACKAAGVPPFFPHQLRHSAATEIRARFGLEGSQAVLGHAELGTTQVYAQRHLETARAIMREVG